MTSRDDPTPGPPGRPDLATPATADAAAGAAPHAAAGRHPAAELPAFVAGRLAEATAADVRRHLDACAACRADVAEWASIAAATREVAAAAGLPSAGLPDRIAARIRGDGSRPSAVRPPLARRLAWLVDVVAGQVPLVRGEIWAASAIVVGIGAVVSLLLLDGTSSRPGGALALFAPLAAAIGVSLVCGPETDPGLELALATPTSPRLIVVARLTLVLAWDLALALAVSLVLALVSAPALLGPLVGLWLGPVLLLGCLSLVLSLLVGAAPAVAAAVVLWALRVVQLSAPDGGSLVAAIRLPLDAVWQTSPLTLGLAAAAFLAAVLLVPRIEAVRA